MLDSHTLVSNAVGAVCFAAAYTVSKTLSRAEAFCDDDQDGDWSEQDGSATDDTDLDSSSSLRNTPAPKQPDPDTLFRLRTHLSQTPCAPPRLPFQELQAEHLTQTQHAHIVIPAPPLRLPFQELQGDMPLYFDPHTRTWTWLEPFPLDNPEEEARLGREAALRRAHWRTRTPPRARKMVERRVDVVWTREEGTTTFVRHNKGGGAVLMLVELPEGEYFPLVDVQGLPFFGLGPPSADATYLTTDGWIPVSVARDNSSLDTDAASTAHHADAAPPLTPSPSNERKRKGVHFDDIPYVKIVDRIQYKVSRSRTDEDVRAALRRVRAALEELEDLLLGPEEEEDPFAFTYALGEQERVNAREEQEQPNERGAQEQPHAREEHSHPHAHAHAQHADLHTPTKPAPAAAATRMPFQILTPSSLERPAPRRTPRMPSAAYRSSSAPPELYSPTPAPPSTPTLSGLREDSPTPAARGMNGRHI